MKLSLNINKINDGILTLEVDDQILNYIKDVVPTTPEKDIILEPSSIKETALKARRKAPKKDPKKEPMGYPVTEFILTNSKSRFLSATSIKEAFKVKKGRYSNGVFTRTLEERGFLVPFKKYRGYTPGPLWTDDMGITAKMHANKPKSNIKGQKRVILYNIDNANIRNVLNYIEDLSSRLD